MMMEIKRERALLGGHGLKRDAHHAPRSDRVFRPAASHAILIVLFRATYGVSKHALNGDNRETVELSCREMVQRVRVAQSE